MAMTRLRMWDWGMRQAGRLPEGAQFAFGPFLFWPCVVVSRWRLFLGLGVLTAAGLSVARWQFQMGDDLDWGSLAGLSTIHIWFPVVILGPVLLPYTLLAGLLVWITDRRRGRQAKPEPGGVR
jgi:hypothetical protein